MGADDGSWLVAWPEGTETTVGDVPHAAPSKHGGDWRNAVAHPAAAAQTMRPDVLASHANLIFCTRPAGAAIGAARVPCFSQVRQDGAPRHPPVSSCMAQGMSCMPRWRHSQLKCSTALRRSRCGVLDGSTMRLMVRGAKVGTQAAPAAGAEAGVPVAAADAKRATTGVAGADVVLAGAGAAGAAAALAAAAAAFLPGVPFAAVGVLLLAAGAAVDA